MSSVIDSTTMQVVETSLHQSVEAFSKEAGIDENFD